MRGVFRLMVVVVVVCAVGWAQLPTSTLNGTVADPQGAVVSGAKVSLTQTATGASREFTTGADGNYTFSNLAPGDYTMRVETKGFAIQEMKGLHLDVGVARTQNVSLKVAEVGQVVTVTSEEAGVELTQSQVQGLIASSTVENIPLNGRNFLELAYLIPGNRPGTNYDPTKTNTLEVSSAGQFGRGGNLTVDGGDNNDEVVGGTLANFPEDGVQEFQIVTNRFTSEVGRSGSSIINIITKSGTNAWHGSGFFFFRQKSLQWQDALLKGTSKPPFDREQFGGSLGGPIIRDKAFWFVSVEDRNQDAAVPVKERNLADYASCRVTETASCIIKTAAPAPLDDVLLNSRADFKLSDHDNFFARYAFNRSLETANGSLSLGSGTAANRQSSLNRFNSLVTDWTRQMGNNKINDLLFHLDLFINEIPAFTDNTALTDPAGIAAGHEIRFLSGGLQDGANFRVPQRTRMNRYQIKDNFSWTVGKHNLRFGGEWQNSGADILFDLFGSGSIFTLEDFATQDRNNDLAINDLDIPVLLTVLGTAAVRPPTAPYYRNNYFGFYFQDDWKVASNLTLNLGLRWDFDTDVLGEGHLSQPCADPTVLTTTAGCVWIRSVLGPHNAPKFHNFGPRFGFAWDPFKKGTTVVRGGYGIYYDRVVLEVPILEPLIDGRVLRIGALGGSVCTNVGGDCSLAGALFDVGTPTLDNPFVGVPGPIPLGGFNVVDNHAQQPLIHQFSFGVQHQFGTSWTVSADAVHNFGQRLLTGRFLRQGTSLIPAIPLIVDPSSGFPGPCPASGGVDPCAVTDPATGIPDRIQLIASAAKSWYDGLLASVRKAPTGRGAWKWGFNASYTLSKSYNFANDDQIPFNGAEDAVNLIFGTNNSRLEKGYAPTDERHRFTFYGIFEAPWKVSVSPIWTISSSVPMDPFVPALNARLPILQRNSLGRDIRNGAELNAVIDTWNALTPCLDPTVTAPSARIFPCHAGPTLLHVDDKLEFGDIFSSIDFRVTKTWTFAERHNVQFITEAFNILNTTNIRGFNNKTFSGFNNAITSSAFNTPLQTAGRFFGAGGARAFQFAVRYSF